MNLDRARICLAILLEKTVSMKRTTVRLTEAALRQPRQRARREGKSVSALIRELVESGLRDGGDGVCNGRRSGGELADHLACREPAEHMQNRIDAASGGADIPWGRERIPVPCSAASGLRATRPDKLVSSRTH